MRTILLLMCFLALAPLAAAEQRNVVLIVADDMGLQMGAYGDRQAHTPHLDRLASQGTRFTRAYCTTASCSASRSVILSGLQNHATGQYGHAHGDSHFSAFDSVRSLPVLLGEAGYRTACIGKYHVAPEAVFRFDEYPNDGIQGSRNGIRMAANARRFIEADRTRPCFVYYCSADPHRSGQGFGNETQYQGHTPVKFDPQKIALPAWLPDLPEARREWAEFHEAIARFDQGVGALLAAIEETGHADDTLVLFISDNGPPFPGAKTTQYDPGVRLPLVVRKPGQKEGRVSDALVNWTDLTPTILDWAGVKEVTGQYRKVEVGSGARSATTPAANRASAPYKFHGRSFLSLVDAEANAAADDWSDTYLSHQFHELTMYYPMRTYVDRRYKLIYNIAHPLPYPFASDLHGSRTWQAVLRDKVSRYGRRSVEEYVQRPQFELYDLQNDPDETRNLADDPSQAVRLRGMQENLKAFQQRTADPWVSKWIYE